MNRITKKILIRICALLCSAMLLFLSPCARYLDASGIDTANAAELVLAGEAAAYAAEWLIALLATVGLGSVAYENRDAIVSSYKEYLEAQIDTEMFIMDSVKDTCIQIYDKTSNTIQKIPWQTLLDNLQDCHDISINNLAGIYIKYCPQLLNSFNDYTTEVLSGDVYVSGVSDAIITDNPFTASDLEAQWNGSLFKYTCYAEITFDNFWGGIRTWTYDCSTSAFYPIAGYLDTKEKPDGNTDTILRFQSSKFGSATMSCYSTTIQDGNVIYRGNKTLTGTGSVSTANNGVMTFNANFPVFSIYDEAIQYFKTGKGYENAINYGPSFYDSITDNSDLPPFYQTWQQEQWERVANAPDCGIGSYGSGNTVNDWADDIPWISLDSLLDYALSLLDTYHKLIDDILNGIYDSNEDIPDTYSEAWEDTITDCWDDVVDKSEVPDEGGKEEPSEKDEDNKSTSWYNEDGTLNYPPNDGAVPGTEETITLKPGDVVGRYGKIGKDSDFVTQPGADPDTLSLPPTTDPSIYQEFIVEKEIVNVIQSEILPWGDSSGHGIQYQLPMPILELIDQEYLNEIK